MCQELRMTIRMPVHLRSDNGKIVFSRSTGVSSQFNQVSYKKISEVTEKGKKREAKAGEKMWEIVNEVPKYQWPRNRHCLTSWPRSLVSETLDYVSFSPLITHIPPTPSQILPHVLRNDNKDHYLLWLYSYYYFYSYVGRPLFFLASLDFCTRTFLSSFLVFLFITFIFLAILCIVHTTHF